MIVPFFPLGIPGYDLVLIIAILGVSISILLE